MSPLRSSSPLLALTALVLLLPGCQKVSAGEANEPATTPVPAQTSSSSAADLENFQPTNEYKLLVADVLDPDARFMISNTAGAVLVLTTKLPSPVVLKTRTQEVEKVDPSAVEQHADGTTSVPSAAQLGVVTRFVPGDKGVMFSYEGTLAKVELDIPEPLVGDQTIEALYEHSPDYRVKANNYRPNASQVEEIKAFGRDTRVQVVFGSWCHVCSEYLPHLLKVAEQVAGSKIEFDYLGIPDWDYPDVKRLRVTSLPTAIVYVDDTEVGRFSGAADFRAVEGTLLEVLKKAP